MGKTFPLAGDVSYLKLELRSGEPGVWRLQPKLAQLHLARPWLLLLKSGSILLLLNVHTMLTLNVYREISVPTYTDSGRHHLTAAAPPDSGLLNLTAAAIT